VPAAYSFLYTEFVLEGLKLVTRNNCAKNITADLLLKYEIVHA
jgi:hypothetical protein